MRIRSFALSDIGLVRTENQDSSGCFPDWNLFVVADGMGGHAGGREASELAVRTIEEGFRSPAPVAPPRSPSGYSAAVHTLVDGICQANSRIHGRGNSEEDLRGMGTTLVALLFESDTSAAIAHVGDSRAYRLRADRVEQLTTDHSLVADLLKRSEISEAEARRHPYRHVLTRAVGVAETVIPEISHVDVQPGDLYVLCSDGVYGMVASAELDRILVEGRAEPEQVCQRLIAAAKAGGGRDNATAVAVLCTPE